MQFAMIGRYFVWFTNVNQLFSSLYTTLAIMNHLIEWSCTIVYQQLSVYFLTSFLEYPHIPPIDSQRRI